jgi:hypothetical protein
MFGDLAWRAQMAAVATRVRSTAGRRGLESAVRGRQAREPEGRYLSATFAP